jgi:hypothetical protein
LSHHGTCRVVEGSGQDDVLGEEGGEDSSACRRILEGHCPGAVLGDDLREGARLILDVVPKDDDGGDEHRAASQGGGGRADAAEGEDELGTQPEPSERAHHH